MQDSDRLYNLMEEVIEYCEAIDGAPFPYEVEYLLRHVSAVCDLASAYFLGKSLTIH